MNSDSGKLNIGYDPSAKLNLCIQKVQINSRRVIDMTSYKEILRLHSLGINNTRIALGCGCSRTTVINVLQRAKDQGLSWQAVADMSDKELSQRLFPSESAKPAYKMPDYEYIHREMAKSGVTLTLLWLEYCDQCRESGQVPYKSTQFNKYYADYVQSTKATMHIHRKPGEIMEVDWAGQTARIIDTDTGEIIPAYMFVAALPYSGYAYVEAFLSQNQECWITAHVNAYRFFGGVTRIWYGQLKNRRGESDERRNSY